MFLNQDLAFQRVQELCPGVADHTIHEVFDRLFAWEDDGIWELLAIRAVHQLTRLGFRAIWDS